LRQLGEVDRHAARLVPGQQVGGCPSPRLLLKKIAKRLPVLVSHDEASVVRLVDGPDGGEQRLDIQMGFPQPIGRSSPA
jgi:hypothetical protein